MRSERDGIDSTLIRMTATSRTPLSRADLAGLTGLSKMTIGRHVADLIQEGVLVESVGQVPGKNMGRTPAVLSVSDALPVACGTLIKRSYIQTILMDISGRVIDETRDYYGSDLTAETLSALMTGQYDRLSGHTQREIFGWGISAIGPVDKESGCILKPAQFYGITDYPAVALAREHMGGKRPAYLLHDASAGALAEKIYGKGAGCESYIYIHIEEGIGLSFVQNGHQLSGYSNQSGEIGHTYINFNGPKCSCGSNGCLELYASVPQMRKKIRELLLFSPDSAFSELERPSWADIVRLASQGDMIAVAALDEFCGYLVYAIVNALNLMRSPMIILGYDSLQVSGVVTKMIRRKLRRIHRAVEKEEVKVLQSAFDNAPLIGAAAAAVEEAFCRNAF